MAEGDVVVPQATSQDQVAVPSPAGVALSTPAAGPIAPVPAPTVVPDKFKNTDGTVNTDALLASYAELEKKQAAPAQTPEEKAAADAAKATADAATAAKAAEDAAKGENKPDAQDTLVVKALTEKGLSVDDFTAEYAADGKLSPDSYAKLDTAGFPQQMVDTYVAGLVATQAASDDHVTAIKDAAGGEEKYGELTSWAKQNLSAAAIADFDKQVDDPALAALAVKNLGAQRDKAMGIEPALISGGGTPGADVFRSYAEVKTAMQDKRYGNDPAYTKDVEQKALRSDI